jgi:cytochrome P450
MAAIPVAARMAQAPDVDLLDGRFYANGDAREAFRWMRAYQPVFRDRNGQAAVTTYRAVIDAERNPQLFSNAGGIHPRQPPVPNMIDMDDPQHLLRRKLVNTGFTRKRVRQMASSIARLCDELIDAVCESGTCDLVRDIAAHFCLGNQLARIELSIMLSALLRRLPDLRLTTEAQLPSRPTSFITGPEVMPVVFTPSIPIAQQCG